MVFRLISLFILSVCFSQAWASVAASSFELSYSYDENIEYSYGGFEVETSGISRKNHIYDGSSNLSLCCSDQSARQNSQQAREGYFFAFLDGLVVAKGGGKSLKDQAADLIPKNANKNRVTLRSPSQKMELDLAGRTHGDVPTPHTKVSPRNLKAPNQPAFNTKNSPVRPATQQDIRTARKFLERQK